MKLKSLHSSFLFYLLTAVFLLASAVSVAGQPPVTEDERDERDRVTWSKSKYADGKVITVTTVYHPNTASATDISTQSIKTESSTPFVHEESVMKYDTQRRPISSSLQTFNRGGKRLTGESRSWKYVGGIRILRAEAVWNPEKKCWNFRNYEDPGSNSPEGCPDEVSQKQDGSREGNWLVGTWVGYRTKERSDPYILEFVREGDKIVGYLRKNNYWSKRHGFKEGQEVWSDLEVRRPKSPELYRFEAVGTCISNQGYGWTYYGSIQVRQGSEDIELDNVCGSHAAKITRLGKEAR